MFVRRLNKCNALPILRGHGFSYSKLNKVLKSDTFNVASCLNKELLMPKSVILNFKATDYSSNDSIGQYDFIAKKIVNMKTVTLDIIDILRQEVKSLGRHINDYNFDAIFLEICRIQKSFSVGKDFFYLLYSENKCNLATIGKFFRLCYDFPSECSEDDKSLLIKIYRDLLVKYSFLDTRTCENVALGLTITKEWKEGLNLLKMTELSSSPSSKFYSALIETAFINNESNIAKELLIKMVSDNKNPPIEVYEAWLKSCEYMPSTAYYEILKFIIKYSIHPLEDVAKLLLNTCNNIEGNRKHCAVTSIHHMGRCNNCQKQLKKVSLTQEEFLKLRSAFLNPVLIGKNVFLKTKPEELDLFFSFIRNIKKVDFVLDGLNIAYSADNNAPNKSSATCQNLYNVVQHFSKLKKRVAVIGRKHMASWPKKYLNYIMQNSKIFLAENVSADDPYLLYTAMHSGLGTYFVSRDQMRSHRFLLKDPELQEIFTRWQQMHQYYLNNIDPQGSVNFVKPLPYMRSPQESEPGVWHIPISTPMDGVLPHQIASRTQWLCLN